MKKVILILLMFFFALSLYALDPVVKFYLNDGSQTKEYKIADISRLDFIKSNLSYSMEIFANGSINTYNVIDINSIEFINSTKLTINLLSSSENFSITDIDSIIFIPNTCTEVVIGTQTWMCKNLDVDHYRNGDEIPQVTDSIAWVNLTSGAWCYYNNDPALGAVYGKLYNWYAVNDSRGLAPDGWHVPSDEEWTTLSDYLGGESVAGGKLKEAGTTHWLSPNTGATNETGFSALPGGSRHYNYGWFGNIGFGGDWWSSTEGITSHPWSRALNLAESGIYKEDNYQASGFSVRCIKDLYNPILNSITPTSASIGDIVTLSGAGFGATQGTNYVSFNDTKPQQSDYQSWSDTEIKLKVPIGATTSKVSVTVNGTKINGLDFIVLTPCTERNSYTSDTIGTQVWMGENLDVCFYRNGDTIPQITDSTEWKNLKTGAWCYYKNEANNGTTYGKLYNWYALNDTRGLAPVGWHVASDDEWTTLTNYIGGDSVACGKLKSLGTIEAGDGLWYSPNTGATNEIGFSGLPGGARTTDGIFYNMGYSGYWWSSTMSYTTGAWSRYLFYNVTVIYRRNDSKSSGFSVRCVKDSEAPTLNSISPTSAEIGEIITLTGTGFRTTQGTGFVSFNSINPKQSDYQSWSATEIKLKVPTGALTGKVSVTVNGTKSNDVDFTVKPTDPDGNKSVTIGTQIWMKKNLDVSTYRDGTKIRYAETAVDWADANSKGEGAWCYYNNDPDVGAIYGKLYNWYAVKDSRGLAPTGWHVPSDGEWTTLSDYLGGESLAGSKLKSTGTIEAKDGLWYSPNTDATDKYGFSALPAGYRGFYGTYYAIGYRCYWWSSNEYSTAQAWSRFLYNLFSSQSSYGIYKGNGFAVRCVKD
ncbi:MAG: FISUMP domain-containing protein [bacterium]